jgi:hypothetical protein
MIYLVNASDSTIAFHPKSVNLTAERSGRSNHSVFRLATFGGEEYEKKVRNRQAWAAALYGFSAAMSNHPQPATGTYSGSFNAYGTGGNAWGSYNGTITTWPTAADYAAAQARTQAQIGAMAGQLKASFQAMSSELLRSHSMPPHSYHGGVVHFDKKKADQYSVVIPFGGADFVFSFSRD